eukprot:TRINITY_DN53563_c0_g1_i1.p1 TRINITY_DN53563_c0_g1~~TRINITY_DN53563_c0_g1_i1.p1  ORF type:complete len:524 (+),score=66.55 TRINITY_DN53563_c0_g1_i1:269-1840(+)
MSDPVDDILKDPEDSPLKIELIKAEPTTTTTTTTTPQDCTQAATAQPDNNNDGNDITIAKLTDAEETTSVVLPMETRWLNVKPPVFAPSPAWLDKGIHGTEGECHVYYTEQTFGEGEAACIRGKLRGFLVKPINLLVDAERAKQFQPKQEEDPPPPAPGQKQMYWQCQWCEAPLVSAQASDANLLPMLFNTETAQLVSLDAKGEMKLHELWFCHNGHFEMLTDTEQYTGSGLNSTARATLDHKAGTSHGRGDLYFANLYYSMILHKTIAPENDALKIQTRIRRAGVSLAAGHWQAAVADCTHCLKLYQTLHQALMTRAKAYEKLGEYRFALQDAQKAHSLNRTPDTQALLQVIGQHLPAEHQHIITGGYAQAPYRAGLSPQGTLATSPSQAQESITREGDISQQLFPQEPRAESPQDEDIGSGEDEEEEEGADDLPMSCPLCNQPDDDDMVACDKCNRWFHFPRCSDYDPKQPEEARWYCEECTFLRDPYGGEPEHVPKKRRKKQSTAASLLVGGIHHAHNVH